MLSTICTVIGATVLSCAAVYAIMWVGCVCDGRCW